MNEITSSSSIVRCRAIEERTSDRKFQRLVFVVDNKFFQSHSEKRNSNQNGNWCDKSRLQMHKLVFRFFCFYITMVFFRRIQRLNSLAAALAAANAANEAKDDDDKPKVNKMQIKSDLID